MANAKKDWTPGVLDTALWVALHRARESAREDNLFTDKWALHLVGAENVGSIEKLPRIYSGEWKYALRTATIDTFIEKVVANGNVDVVVNLGAGLDMRPYRLSVPPHIVWAEIDFSSLIKYKEDRLTTFSPYPIPHCIVRRVGCDLSSPAERQQVFADLAVLGRRWLVITEGLLIYLEAPAVKQLMQEVGRYCQAGYWISDYVTDLNFSWYQDRVAAFLNYLRTAEKSDITFKFCVPREQGAHYFADHGWEVVEDHSIYESAFRYGRRPPFLLRLQAFLGWSAKSAHIRGMSGCCLLKKS